MSKQDTLFVASLEKGLRVLNAFSTHRESLGITDIALATNLDKSAAQRFTNTLHRLGYLEKDEQTRRYRPAISLMDFSYTYLQQDRLAEIAVARLIEAGKVFGTTVNLCVLVGTDILYTVRIPHEKASFAATVPGRRMPAFCTAGGMSILAFRPADEVETIINSSDIRAFTEHTITDREAIMHRIANAHKYGYDIGTGQALPNEISVAAPVIDHHGNGIAAVQIPVYKPQWTQEDAVAKLAPLAMETARSISGSLYQNF
jgi:IclR family transcriptional regulator, pca regulon regulatory protein